MSSGAVNPQSLRGMQIIAVALILGVLFFLGIAVVISMTRAQQQADGLPFLSILAVVFFVASALASFMVPSMMTQQALKQIAAGSWIAPAQADPAAFATDEGKLLGVRLTTLIVTLALLEAAAFMGCIALLLEGQLFVLAVVGVAILLMLANFPTANRVRTWLDLQLGRLTELRQYTSGL